MHFIHREKNLKDQRTSITANFIMEINAELDLVT